MAQPAEILIPDSLSRTGLAMLTELSKHAKGIVTRHYKGTEPTLVLYGVGAKDMSNAHEEHLRRGGHVIMWDQGYFGRKKIVGYLRVSIDYWHPQHLLSRTDPRPGRWLSHGIPLRQDYSESGPIILVGIPPKSRAYLGEGVADWELDKYKDLRNRFPRTKIIYRPKPKRVYPQLPCPVDTALSIEELLRNASLVSVRHSNVAVDAVIAGVPFECSDGAAKWLEPRVFSTYNRLDFMERLAYWQWHPAEAREAWQFLSSMLEQL